MCTYKVNCFLRLNSLVVDSIGNKNGILSVFCDWREDGAFNVF